MSQRELDPEAGRMREPGPATVAGVVIAAIALVVGVLLLTVVVGGSGFDSERISEVARDGGSDDPFSYTDERAADFERRAELGYSHVLYEKSPGGIVTSARRTARWRDEIEAAAAAHGTDPDLMEAMVLLESAGRPEVIAGDDPEVASGLAQIVAETGPGLLGMKVDLRRSRALTKRIYEVEAEIAKATRDAASGNPKERSRALLQLRKLPNQEAALHAERASIDERFDPIKALDGMGIYLEIAEERFGRTDLATVSYHMGIGNLESAMADYEETTPTDDPTYTRLFFDSSPLQNAAAWGLLASLGDDSSTYLWRVLAAERIMDLYRSEGAELKRLAKLHGAKATQEEVFHPEDETQVFADPGEIEKALEDEELLPIPEGAEFGYVVDKGMGELAPELGVDRSLYRALRPEALATLIYMASRVREINDGKGELTVTSADRDQQYQDELVGINGEATGAYSLHTTGYSFDILRDYSSDRQAEAFQFMLDRLRALDVIDYAVEPEAIHITVSNEAAPLLDL
jgi:hypothetical protein